MTVDRLIVGASLLAIALTAFLFFAGCAVPPDCRSATERRWLDVKAEGWRCQNVTSGQFMPDGCCADLPKLESGVRVFVQ